ncbi:hypothetical protein SELMODRAFT_427552 [Selaginella moellendorffii]|uniref:Uncharacterized protein JAR1L8-2 n=1 Tax=Selaginella moellendorffii TaxID=88036 RepID=D8SZZ1_SELML|nr:hypothetical protein SELMODRAFT_427552 [Selaginella moellendorffii]
MEDFEAVCKNAVQAQEEALVQILQRNGSCQYLQRSGQPLCLKSFKAQLPIISYDNISPELQQIADHGTSHLLLGCDPILYFTFSSGTSSGKHKILPQTNCGYSLLARAYASSNAYRDEIFPLESTKPIGLHFVYSGEQYKAKSGLLIGAGSTNYYKSEAYNQEAETLATPYEALLAGSDWQQTTYCHLLCGLVQRHKIEFIHATFAYTLSEVFRLLESNWKILCEDISARRVSESKVTDEKLRVPVLKLMERELRGKDSSQVAREISEIFIAGTESRWSGLLPLLWPRAKYVHTVVTGAMEPYIPVLKKYAGDKLAIVGFDYSASEGYLGINMRPATPPEEVVFTLIPYTMFFEFIPVDPEEVPDHQKGETLGFKDLQVGKQYELVVTTFEGFACPLEIANFTSCADFTTKERPHYVIYWELKNDGDNSRHEELRDSCNALDRGFNAAYLTGGVDKTLGALELVTVKQGTFEKLMEKAIESGALASQYKTPRCIKSPALLELLDRGAIGRYTSSEDISSLLAEDWKPSVIHGL